jgi:hypothetical protein
MANAPILAPLPPPNVAITGAGGATSQQHAQYLSSLDAFLRGGNFPAVSVNGNAVLTVAAKQTLLAGFNETVFPFGTGSGTITPNPSSSLKQSVTNNGAFTIAATAEVGDVELFVSNGASAGAIAFSGFTKQWAGDALDTVNGHAFVIFIYGFGGNSAYLVKAMQ